MMRSAGPLLAAAVLWAVPVAAQQPTCPVDRNLPWVTDDAGAPRVTFRTFDSQVAAGKVSYHAYTPAEYDEPGARLPVLYWLHGTLGGTEGIRPLSAHFDSEIRAGRMPPMIVVFVNGLPRRLWADSKNGSAPVETMFITELIPEVDRSFRTTATREGRILEGFSMGGYGAARLGFKYADLFAGVSILAGGPLDLDLDGPRARRNPRLREFILREVCGGELDHFRAISPWTIAAAAAASINDRKTVIRHAVGARDDTRDLNRRFHDRMVDVGIAHEYTELPDVGHDALAVLAALAASDGDFYRRGLGRPAARGITADGSEPTAAAERAGEWTPAIDRYRLCRIRDTALRRLDGAGVAKLVEIAGVAISAPRWTAAHVGELQLLLEQMETRYGLLPPDSIPPGTPPEATAFAVPRREWREVRFAESPGVDAAEQSLDVYAPPAGDRHPIVVWFHGGGMTAGDKANAGVTVLKPDFFVSRGCVFASVNYRLAPRHVHPAQADDVAAAIAWVHGHAAGYGGDPGKLFAIGVSAGAHLAAVVASNERFLATHGLSPRDIAGAVILDIGSFDIPDLMERSGDRAGEMYRAVFPATGREAAWRDCSPGLHIRADAVPPPLLLCYAEGREHHARENARFAARVRDAGGRASVLTAVGKTHLSLEAEVGTRSDPVTAAILRFLAAPNAFPEADAPPPTRVPL